MPTALGVTEIAFGACSEPVWPMAAILFDETSYGIHTGCSVQHLAANLPRLPDPVISAGNVTARVTCGNLRQLGPYSEHCQIRCR